jgi:hypothetical protein
LAEEKRSECSRVEERVEEEEHVSNRNHFLDRSPDSYLSGSFFSLKYKTYGILGIAPRTTHQNVSKPKHTEHPKHSKKTHQMPTATAPDTIATLEESWGTFLTSPNETKPSAATDASGLSKLESYTAIQKRFSVAHSNWKTKHDAFCVELSTPATTTTTTTTAVSATPGTPGTTVQTLSDSYAKQGTQLDALLASADMDDPHVDRVMQLWHELDRTHATLLAHLNHVGNSN